MTCNVCKQSIIAVNINNNNWMAIIVSLYSIQHLLQALLWAHATRQQHTRLANEVIILGRVNVVVVVNVEE